MKYSTGFFRTAIVVLLAGACTKEATKGIAPTGLVTYSDDHSVPLIIGQKTFRDPNVAMLEVSPSGGPGGAVVYKLAYRPLSGGSKWKEQTATSSDQWIILSRLEAGVDYEVRVARACSPSSTTGYSQLVRISMQP